MTDRTFRYGIDVPLEMRPKLYDKLTDPNTGRFFPVAVDAFFESPQLIDAIKKQEEDSKRFVERLLEVISQHEEDAIAKLVEAGVSLDRLTKWTEQGTSRGGFLVDCPADAETVEPYKACTISTELAPTENRWDFVVSTAWHGEWRRLAR